MKGKIEKIHIKDRDCFVYLPACYDDDLSREYPVIYCNDGDIMMDCFDEIADGLEKFFDENEDRSCILVMIPPVDRNTEYTPWKSKNPFNKETFYGNADEYIDYLVNCVKTEINTKYNTKTEREYNYILGYSLGGLVSLYTMYKSDKFMKAACISSSLWYENWHDFIRNNEIKDKNSYIFLCLGKNESKSRNAVLKTVLQRTKETYGILKTEIGERVTFKLNDGGHFDNVADRYLKAIIEIMTIKDIISA